MLNFWDYNVWGFLNLLAVLLGSILLANVLKRHIPFLQASLVPTSVLGGGVLLAIVGIWRVITGEDFFETPFFGGNGTATLELITYHMLALGFTASAFKTSEGQLTKERRVEIFNTGVTTVATYLLQAVFGFGITLVAAKVIEGFFPAAGVLLPFGYGQGTGQALNYGSIYEMEHGFVNGKSFGLTIAALGFLSASIGGVIHLNLLKRKGLILHKGSAEGAIHAEDIQTEGEIPMQESIDKMTIQIALVAAAYMLTYLMMMGLGNLLPGLRSVIYGFNFILGVLSGTVLRSLLNWFRKTGMGTREYVNNFLMTRVSNFFFDVMVVSGIAAIRLSALEKYWGIMLILGIVGLVITYAYNYVVSKLLFPRYSREQFLAMYGMLTGTASTGIILLREIDGDFKTPAADNMVYQNFPAIVFGFPLMFLATLAPVQPGLTFVILVAFLGVMNVILFRSFLFKKKR